MQTPLRYIFDPFKIIKEFKLDFFIWIVFAILASQLGILVNVIIRFFTHSIPISQSIFLDSYTGSFYTYAIAVAASALGPLFANFIKNKKPEFTSIKIVSIILIIFFLIISSVIYAAVQVKPLSSTEIYNLKFDYPQLSVYLLAIFISIYTYCLLKIESPKFAHLENSFDNEDDENVKEVISESDRLNDDGTGVKLQ